MGIENREINRSTEEERILKENIEAYASRVARTIFDAELEVSELEVIENKMEEISSSISGSKK